MAKRKAYNYKNAKSANAAGYTTKQYQRSVAGKRAWDNKSKLQKDRTLDNLRRGQARAKRIQAKQIEAYEIVSQSHYEARGKTEKGKKYRSLFEYTTKGYFENEPTLDKLETMGKNSLISAFNSGRSGRGGYLKDSAFNTLVEGHMRGIKVQKVKVDRDLVTNKMSAELKIVNNGNKWKGTN